jgi:hypothetical protein
VEFDITLQGGRGKLLALTNAQKRWDDAHTLVNKTIEDNRERAAQLVILTSQSEALKKEILDLQEEMRNNPQPATAEKIAAKQAELDKITSQITTNQVLQKSTTAYADMVLVMSKVDADIYRRSSDPDTRVSDVNISVVQSRLNGLYTTKIAELKTLNSTDPGVTQAIKELEAQKVSMNTEFDQQNAIDSILNSSTSPTKNPLSSTIISKINNDIIVQKSQLTGAGLASDAKQYEIRAQERIVALCNIGKICTK